MNLPTKYQWLLQETGPKMIIELIRVYGTKETPGDEDNPVIMKWAKEVGVERDYRHDAVPWCGLAMAVIAKRSGKEVNFPPLWAKNWAQFGERVTDGAQLGDVLVFTRSGGAGHVGLYIGEDDDCYHVGGGNQADMINIARVAKDRLYAVRRPIYKVKPANVRRILLDKDGEVSRDEA